MVGYIVEKTLFSHDDAVGFGDENFYIKEINREIANKYVKENHYSKKVYSATYIHLGLYINSVFSGVLQFGYAMNPASQSSVVSGTNIDEYLELNRMVLDDGAERNSESRAISYAIKYIKRKYRKIKWIQSFADERCGKFGIVYQAANFSYYGEHTNIFWELDGEFYHNIHATVAEGTSRYYGKSEYLQKNISMAKKHVLRQFRYIYFINKKYKDRCLYKELPYPKHYKGV